jgi:hypothetical protein
MRAYLASRKALAQPRSHSIRVPVSVSERAPASQRAWSTCTLPHSDPHLTYLEPKIVAVETPVIDWNSTYRARHPLNGKLQDRSQIENDVHIWSHKLLISQDGNITD